MEIGIAGWAFNRWIREQKSLTLLQFPALAREEYGVGVVDFVFDVFESDGPVPEPAARGDRAAPLGVANIAVDTGSLASPNAKVRQTDLENQE